MEQVKSNPIIGEDLSKEDLFMKDLRWPASEGWVKMQQEVITYDGKIVIHYVRNTSTGWVDDFKFYDK